MDCVPVQPHRFPPRPPQDTALIRPTGRNPDLLKSPMVTQRPTQDPLFGYLSTLESADHGFFGGYLIVSPLGRPLEFHCTAPVQPSRAQQILYGPTLQTYLLGEQIAGTLLAQAKLRPSLILTDQFAAFCLRSQAGVPMVWWANAEQAASDSGHVDPANTEDLMEPAESTNPLGLRRFDLGGFQWELPSGFEADRQTVVSLLQTLTRQVEPTEPFGRIHEAIREAQRIGQRNQDAHGQAA
jgi:hypothetical protein